MGLYQHTSERLYRFSEAELKKLLGITGRLVKVEKKESRYMEPSDDATWEIRTDEILVSAGGN